jgi:hypothetical protein
VSCGTRGSGLLLLLPPSLRQMDVVLAAAAGVAAVCHIRIACCVTQPVLLAEGGACGLVCGVWGGGVVGSGKSSV